MVDRERSLLLHVGITKTGSTTLQDGLFARHSQVYFLGKWGQMPGELKGCRSHTVYEILRPLLWDRMQKPAAAERLWREQILPTIPAERQPVASWEQLGETATCGHRERLNRFKSVFGRIRLLISIRNPLTQVPSVYLQQLRRNAVRRKLPWMGRRLYVDMQEWYDHDRKRRPAKLSNYAWNIQASMEELGEENVGVFLFEVLQEDPAAYHSAICRFMGIDAAEGVRLTEHEHRNPRITEHQLDRLKEIDRSFWKRRRFHRKTMTERKRDLRGNLPWKAPETVLVEAVVPRRLSDAVSEATREGNQWLVERLGLPLEEYGYPL